ncbi:hypothetical protein SAMN04488072_103275 [Lentibacillus halodurans]|uniref:Repeat domain-containing protein n=1 Tax=Lentibacillus halodurans TaxID=237679 RepID=A0A1I0WV59_9BACI|nr:hypothetical protein [Lentibacillus halodurans]SFA92048.1 hypothetical protein SAMN04488072_103275 [Lentibacillus halodurans]
MRLFTFIAVLIGLFIPVIAASEEDNQPSSQQLAEHHKDVTDDSTEETIELEGLLFAPDSDYYAEIWAAISDNDGQEWEILYEGGYEPDIQFYDLNHDGVKDIFYQSATGGNGGLHHYQLHTLKNKQLQEIPLPKQEYLHAEFKDNFQAEIQIDHEQEPNVVNIKDRSSEYVQLGIYDENGKLIDNTSPLIAPIAFFEPVEISERKGYGLKSHQQISGAYQADELGTVETLWYYENDKWIILKTEWVPA